MNETRENPALAEQVRSTLFNVAGVMTGRLAETVSVPVMLELKEGSPLAQTLSAIEGRRQQLIDAGLLFTSSTGGTSPDQWRDFIDVNEVNRQAEKHVAALRGNVGEQAARLDTQASNDPVHSIAARF